MKPIDKYIVALEQLAAHYEKAIAMANTGMTNKEYYAYLDAEKLTGGLCEPLFLFIKMPHIPLVKAEVFEDNNAPFFDWFWFIPPYEVPGQNKKKEECLQPRLDNINRTIARLKAELNQ